MPIPPECNQCESQMRAALLEGGMEPIAWYCVACKRLRLRYKSTTVNSTPTITNPNG